MGMVKTGGNYAAAPWGPTLSARAKYQVDPGIVLFPAARCRRRAPSNFVFDPRRELLTQQPRYHFFFCTEFTRDSLLTLAR